MSDGHLARTIPAEDASQADEVPQFLKVSLAAQFRDVSQVEAFFAHVPRWKVDRLFVLPLDWSRGDDTGFWQGMVPPFRHWRSFPFGDRAMPALVERRNTSEVQSQLEIMDAVYARCLEYNVEFIPSIVLPKFVLNDVDEVRNHHPHMFGPDGRFRLESTAYLPMLETILDDMRNRYPHLAGFELRFSEGSSANIREYSLEDLERLEEWLPLWLAFAETYGTRHDLEMVVFAHHYHASRSTRKRLHRLLNRYPSLWVLEDLTWPEEHVALPYLGYLGEEWARWLAQSNPLCVNFLLDTEYMGQGRIPGVLPGWWHGGLRKCRELGISGVNGRTMRWDRSDTLDNWNLLNVDIFCALAHDPDQDATAILEDSVKRRFGAGAATNELTAMLQESERLIRLQSMNGIDFSDHSGFPPPKHLHRSYFDTSLRMKAVSDLFSPSGTALYSETTDEVTADSEWRQQLRTVAREPKAHIDEKSVLVEEVERLNVEAAKIAPSLSAEDGDFVTRSYALWLLYVRGLQLFTELAVVHGERVAGDGTDESKATNLAALSRALDELSVECSSRFGEEALFNLAPRLRTMAQFAMQPTFINDSPLPNAIR